MALGSEMEKMKRRLEIDLQLTRCGCPAIGCHRESCYRMEATSATDSQLQQQRLERARALLAVEGERVRNQTQNDKAET